MDKKYFNKKNKKVFEPPVELNNDIKETEALIPDWENDSMGNKIPVVGVSFKNSGKVYYFSPNNLKIKAGDGVIVETVRGAEYALAATGIISMNTSKLMLPLKSCLRKASPEDSKNVQKNEKLAKDYMETCAKRIAALGLDMNLIDCDICFDNSHITFYFTTSDDNKVDFRELIKDIVPIFKTRIELRQVKRRAKAKTIGGLGICGREVCCNTFLSKCEPVSIKMAKDQNIALSPTKISGVCGKLMCCLRYEQESYELLKVLMPKNGSRATTPDGEGIVLDHNCLSQKVRIKVTLPDGSYDIRDYMLPDIQFTQNDVPCCNLRNNKTAIPQDFYDSKPDEESFETKESDMDLLKDDIDD